MTKAITATQNGDVDRSLVSYGREKLLHIKTERDVYMVETEVVGKIIVEGSLRGENVHWREFNSVHIREKLTFIDSEAACPIHTGDFETKGSTIEKVICKGKEIIIDQAKVKTVEIDSSHDKVNFITRNGPEIGQIFICGATNVSFTNDASSSNITPIFWK